MRVIRYRPMQSTLNLNELYRPIARDMDGVRASIGQLWSDALRFVYGERLPNCLWVERCCVRLCRYCPQARWAIEDLALRAARNGHGTAPPRSIGA